MKQVYIHIGFHKTGTTALQRFCRENEARLLESGILYPQAGRPKRTLTYAHHNLAWTLSGNAMAEGGDEDWGDLREEIDSSAASRILISSEYFLLEMKEKELEKVRASLDGYEVHFLATVRRQDRWLESWYKQGVHWTDKMWSVPDFCEKQIESGACDYAGQLQRWTNVFGGDAIRVLPYPEGEGRDALFERFFEWVQVVPDRNWATAPGDHASPPVPFIKAKRHVNKVLKRVPRGLKRFVAMPLRRQETWLYRMVCRMAPLFYTSEMIPESMAEEIMETCRGWNEVLEDRFQFIGGGISDWTNRE